MILDLKLIHRYEVKAKEKKEIGKLDFIKIESLCPSENITNNVKRKPTEQEKVFVNLLSEKGQNTDKTFTTP